MKKVEILLQSYNTENHNKSVRKMIDLLGCKVVSEIAESVLVEIPNEDVLNILEDMSMCDYITMVIFEN